MTYLSICSGIEAATTAWHPLGWKPIAFSEIEPFPCAVLAHHWPDITNLGDMTKHHDWPTTLKPDLIVGGTPCQAFSVAGLRKGLADPRGNLSLTFLSIVAQYKPQWVVWENVPGVLSDKTGAFGAFLGGLGQLGYGFAYRVLDAQFFGVAQRRRRVFVVANLTDWRRAAAVLFESHSLSGDSPPSRSARKGTSTGFETGPSGAWETGEKVDALIAGTLRAEGEDRPSRPSHVLAFAMRGRDGESEIELGGEIMHALRTSLHSSGIVTQYGEIAGTLTARHDSSPCADQGQNVVAYDSTQITSKQISVATHEVAGTMLSRTSSGGFSNSIDHAAAGYMAIKNTFAVRRLTPTECERLQGFPDDHTLIPFRGKPAADCPRYKAIGNSMAVPVMHWLGKRIQLITQAIYA